MKLTLPVRFKITGLNMIAIGLIGNWIAATNGLINLYRVVDPSKTLSDGAYPYPANFWQLNQAVGYCSISLVILGLLLFFFSKEQDEYIYAVRLESIQFAAVAQIGITIGLSLYFLLTASRPLDNYFPTIVMVSVFGFWLLFITRYSYIVYVKSKSNG